MTWHIPAPAPVTAIPAIATGMLCADPTTARPAITKPAPVTPRKRRPIKSDSAPKVGVTAANARDMAIASQVNESSPPMSAVINATVNLGSQDGRGTESTWNREER